jgi:hypothetical protein
VRSKRLRIVHAAAASRLTQWGRRALGYKQAVARAALRDWHGVCGSCCAAKAVLYCEPLQHQM